MALVTDPLRVGYVPEHFSTPLYFAQRYYGLNATLITFPSGTGAMIEALRKREIDIGIGLTEGWIAGLGSKRHPDGQVRREGGYYLIGSYVDTPLCWAISTGVNRDDIRSVEGLRGKKMGVSRLGSGSHIMGFVLADQHNWLTANITNPPFTAHPLQDFKNLRAGVNSHQVDFFMWEHFTSKRYYGPQSSSSTSQGASSPSSTSSASHTSSTTAHTTPSFNSSYQPGMASRASTAPSSSGGNSGSTTTTSADMIRRVGEIYTPWPSWHIVARHPSDPRNEAFFQSLDHGIAHFESHQDEAVQYISTQLDYSREDAQAWLRTVKFAQNTTGVKKSVVDLTVGILRKANVLVDTRDPDESARMLGIPREEDVDMR